MKRPKCSLLAQRNVASLRLDLQAADFPKRHAGTVRIPRTEHEARAVSRLVRSTTAVLAARLHHRSGGQDWLLGHYLSSRLSWLLEETLLMRAQEGILVGSPIGPGLGLDFLDALLDPLVVEGFALLTGALHTALPKPLVWKGLVLRYVGVGIPHIDDHTPH